MSHATQFDGRTAQQRYDDLMEIMGALPFIETKQTCERYAGPERRTGSRRFQ